MSILSKLAKWVFILCLPILFFTTSIAWGFNSLWLYEYGFRKYDVSQSTGLPASELDKAARSLINYFNSTDEYIHVTVTSDGNSFELFTEEEQLHFKDVKNLVWLDYGALLASLAFLIGYSIVLVRRKSDQYRRKITSNIVWGSGLTLVIILGLGIASLLDFNQLFLQLHYIMFPSNTYWSASGYMLMLFPGGFWYDAALICIAVMAGLAVVFGGSSLIFLRKKSVTTSL